MRCAPVLGVFALAGTLGAGCQSGQAPHAGQVTPVYDPKTGHLTELTADRDGKGTPDLRAQMDGAHFKSVAIDRNGDGKPDRWEYYKPVSGGGPGGEARSELVRADEANGPDGRITRREFYENGVIQRVEEDTNDDGRVDSWAYYQNGALVRLDLDLTGRGTPDRRLVYRPDGSLDHIEVDPDGSGHFRRLDATEPSTGRSENKPPSSVKGGGG
jgi:hypothetical protein